MSKALQLDFLAAGLEDSNGSPLSGATVRTYESDGSTAKAVWEDRGQTQPSAAGKSEFTLDTQGRAEVFGSGVYVVKIWESSKNPDADSPDIIYDDVEYHISADDTWVTIGTYNDNLSTAISTIGASNTTLIIDKPITLTADATVPDNIELKFTRNGIINDDGGGRTLTVNGFIDAGLWQIFGSNLTINLNISNTVMDIWFSDLIQCLNAIGINNQVLQIYNDYTFTTPYTTNSNTNLEFYRGSKITANNVTVVINSPVWAEFKQWNDTINGGTITHTPENKVFFSAFSFLTEEFVAASAFNYDGEITDWVARAESYIKDAGYTAGKILLPAGRYTSTKQWNLTSGFSYIGPGADSLASRSALVIDFQGTGYAIYGDYLQSIYLSGLFLNSQEQVAGDITGLIQLDAITRSELHTVRMDCNNEANFGFRMKATLSGGCYGNVIRQMGVVDAAVRGVEVRNSGAPCNILTFENLRVINSGDQAVYLEDRANQITFINPQIEDNTGHGIQVLGDSITIIGGHIENNDDGINIQPGAEEFACFNTHFYGNTNIINNFSSIPITFLNKRTNINGANKVTALSTFGVYRNPQDVRNIPNPEPGMEAYHDGTNANTVGPAFYVGPASGWRSVVDGTTIT